MPDGQTVQLVNKTLTDGSVAFNVCIIDWVAEQTIEVCPATLADAHFLINALVDCEAGVERLADLYTREGE